MEGYEIVQDNGIGCTPNLQYTNERNGEKFFYISLFIRWDLTHPYDEKNERLLEEANASLLVTVKRICRRPRGFTNINYICHMSKLAWNDVNWTLVQKRVTRQ